jgi:predicted dehydrogenase
MTPFEPPLRQAWDRPSVPRPIVVIGAGGIAENAHLPSYRKLAFPLLGIYDIEPGRSQALAARFGIEHVFDSLPAATEQKDVVFDLAVPAAALEGVLEKLPRGSPVLIQKPMGETLDAARRILGICRERDLVAAMNFQLRFAPNMLALADAMTRGHFGQITDVEVRVSTHTPWGLWDFLRGIPRLEILYHSIHYLDLVRFLLGQPRSVCCRAVRHPSLPDYADSGSVVILEYDVWRNCSVRTNHNHRFGPRHACSSLALEGTAGAAVAKMGVNLSYPKGEPDSLELATLDAADWTPIALGGSWFIEAFEGTMCNLMRFAAGEDAQLVTDVEDCLHTMELVEACYESSRAGGARVELSPS